MQCYRKGTTSVPVGYDFHIILWAPSRVGNVTGYLTSLFMKYSDFTISRSRPEHHNVGCIGCRVSPHTGILERTDIASAKSQGPIDQASLSCMLVFLSLSTSAVDVYTSHRLCAFLYLICFFH